ncbi:MAG: 30S ribosomal subunit protein S6 [Candidatus Westeberhardia cardiocondylae]|nr:30S ribosomal subunit protein S6 [Candidatus Westeberhardia cardiocondylae]
MRNYEVVFMVHPDKFNHIDNILNNFLFIIVDKYGGLVYRLEYWGCLNLTYPIKKLYKAYYFLLNVEVVKNAIDEIKKIFKIDVFVIRSMIIRVKLAITDVSPMMKIREDYT